MGWNSNVFPLLIITPTGGFTGLFVYTPGPGAGHLIDSIAAQAGTDPYGNHYVQGIASYAPGSSAVNSQLTAGVLQFNETSIFSAASVGSNPSAALILGSGQVNSTDNAAIIALGPALSGAVAVVQILNSALELEEQNVPAADGGVTAGPKLFGNFSGHAAVVSDTRTGDGNTYDVERLTLVSAGATINSSTVRVNVFSHHLGTGTYEIDVWMVTQNTTAADAAAWSFAGSGGLVVGAGSLMEFESTTSGTATVGYGASTTFSTSFNSQGTGGNQRVHVRALLVVTTAGTLTYGGLEIVSGNTVTVSAGSRMQICPVVST